MNIAPDQRLLGYSFFSVFLWRPELFGLTWLWSSRAWELGSWWGGEVLLMSDTGQTLLEGWPSISTPVHLQLPHSSAPPAAAAGGVVNSRSLFFLSPCLFVLQIYLRLFELEMSWGFGSSSGWTAAIPRGKYAHKFSVWRFYFALTSTRGVCAIIYKIIVLDPTWSTDGFRVAGEMLSVWLVDRAERLQFFSRAMKNAKR